MPPLGSGDIRNTVRLNPGSGWGSRSNPTWVWAFSRNSTSAESARACTVQRCRFGSVTLHVPLA